MARFKFCKAQDVKNEGETFWLNLDLVMTIEQNPLSTGSKITFIGGKIDTVYVEQTAEEIFAGPTFDA